MKNNTEFQPDFSNYNLISDPLDTFDMGPQAPDRSKSQRVNRGKNLPEDLCAGKHGNNLASVLAHEKAKLGKKEMYATLKQLLREHAEGLTTHEIAELLGEPNRNKFAPRCSELLAQEIIYRTGELRGNCYVLRLRPEYL